MPRNIKTTQEAKTFVSKGEYLKIVEAAKAEGVSVSEYMRRALRDRLQAQKVEGAPLDVRHGGSRTDPQKEVLLTSRPASDEECSGVLCIETAHTPE